MRLDRGLSLTEVAYRTEVTKGFLSQLERGLTSVSVPTLLRVCEVLRIGVGELFAYPDEQVVHGGSRIGMGGEGVSEYLLTPADTTAFQGDSVVTCRAHIRSDARATDGCFVRHGAVLS
ncbi:helix-turn-helix domain-containing protein [Streptomyces sp. NPDC012794]|uniref:helix-turn-helix domain-containing protein n=1 Tax=Streptomyces sp. NPDC012794 TaxID=3364850 RepID=UPI0036CF0909